MKTIKGPGIFLAQFVRPDPPFNSIESLGKWVADLGYTGVQIPTWEKSLFDLEKVAESKTYADEYAGKLRELGLEIIELGSYLQGQVLAMHPAYADGFAPFYPDGLKGAEITEWATDQLRKSVKASVNLGTKNISAMSGGFAWHMIYPWPQRPAGLIDEAFTELARRWRPILDFAHENGVTYGYELHPGSDLYDGATFEMFLDKTNNHPAAGITYDASHFVLQQLDYVEFIKLYSDRIRAFHVKDAEFLPTGRVGVYGGYQDWRGRAGRFRSLGDGQVDFKRVFTAMTEAGYDGWAILEWECCIKSPEQGAREGAPFIRDHIIEATQVAFDDFAGGGSDKKRNRRILGLE
ncbi:MAG: sugar phosphate isomerase/epimerase [Spirochaetaceae bacterium]|nr:MAG: sugar phosphate isomerase/epimerase [Spirochaetaceae bacterium]